MCRSQTDRMDRLWRRGVRHFIASHAVTARTVGGPTSLPRTPAPRVMPQEGPHFSHLGMDKVVDRILINNTNSTLLYSWVLGMVSAQPYADPTSPLTLGLSMIEILFWKNGRF